MKFETIDEWKLRTNKEPRKVDFSLAYGKDSRYKNIKIPKRMSKIKRQIIRDSQASKLP